MGSIDGMGLPRHPAEIQGTAEPLAADVPGDGGGVSQLPALEKRRPYPEAAADLISESSALRLEVQKANRDWTDGLGEEGRAAAQWAAQGGPFDEGRRTFTT